MTVIVWRWQWPTINAELLVSQPVAEVFHRYRQRGWNTERGGQLFVDPANPVGLLLTLATPPHHADRAGWSWLELDAERCRQEIEAANAGGLRLVGYWHTHPQAIPKISPTDRDSFSRFAARHAQDLPHPIAVIVGTSFKPEGIVAWSIRNDHNIEATWGEINSTTSQADPGRHLP